MTPSLCPKCGQTVSERKEAVWDYEANTLRFKRPSKVCGLVWAEVRLTPQQAEIFDHLWVKMPHLATVPALVHAVYRGRDEPEAPDNVVKLQIMKIRRAIKDSPYEIECLFATGYRLVLKEAEE